MPLARIITDSVDDSLELTMQLRARGFLVETVSPDQIPDAPADLEVRLEECSPEDVLSKAAQVTESEDLWVFVAPGALDERARPIRTIPLLPHAFDVPIFGTIPKPVRKWPTEAVAEGNAVELAAPRMQASSTHGLGEISPGSGNGGATSEIAPDLKREPAPVPPAIMPSAAAKSTPDIPPTKVKVVVLPKLTEPQQVPEVPERPKPINAEPATKPATGRVRLRGPYKISFRTGARFWKAIAVGSPLAVVAGVLIVVATLRPHLPPPARPAINPSPSASSAGVKPAKTPPLPPATPQAAGPSFPQVTGAAAPEVTGPAVPQVAVKPVMKPPATPTAKTSQDSTSGKLAASPVGKDSNQAQAAIVSKAQPARRHAVSAEADIVAEDTVVFYDRKPARKAPQDPSVRR
jgi:hypothetical protein